MALSYPLFRHDIVFPREHPGCLIVVKNQGLRRKEICPLTTRTKLGLKIQRLADALRLSEVSLDRVPVDHVIGWRNYDGGALWPGSHR